MPCPAPRATDYHRAGTETFTKVDIAHEGAKLTMLKAQEVENPDSCLNRARSDERIFVLLERDAAAPAAIRAWITERIRLGKNQPDDNQLAEAWWCAFLMEKAQEENGNA